MSALPTATQALGITDRSFLSWPFFEDRHRALADAMKGWIAAGGLPGGGHHEATVDADARARVAALAAGGWLNHCVPGDGPLDVRSLCLLREHLAAADGLADFSFAMQGLGSGPISLFGSDAQRTVLPEVAAGKKIAAFALSEPASGSDVASIATSAPRGKWLDTGGGEDLDLERRGRGFLHAVRAHRGWSGCQGAVCVSGSGNNPRT